MSARRVQLVMLWPLVFVFLVPRTSSSALELIILLALGLRNSADENIALSRAGVHTERVASAVAV